MKDLINKEDTFLVDVRTPAEVAKTSVPGAKNIPLDKVPDNLSEFKEARGPVVVFCKSGGRSEKAMKWLKENGVEDIHNAGGFKDVLNYQKG